MRHILCGVAVLLQLPSWLGLLGSRHWFLDLFAHFRWQYLFASAVVIAWALLRRQRAIAVFGVCTLLLNAALIGRLAWHPHASGTRVADGFALHVLSLNVRTSNPDTAAVLDLVKKTDAQVVFFMEVDERWIHALEALHQRYPHRLTHPRADNFGVALFSRVPWKQAQLLWLGDAAVPAVQAQIRHQNRDLVLLGVHPVPPMNRRYAKSRDLLLQSLAEHVSRLQEPALVVGDLNATPWSTGMRLATDGRLGQRSLTAPWAPTWRARSVFAIPIDHALATAPLVITRRVVGPDVGSDHRPLDIAVGWESPTR